MRSTYALLHEDMDLFDSLWYAAFPPRPPGGPGCDVDGILEGAG